jgi:uncharacterized membrane protein YeaQ/YmgE (transglycosylase-associated protein family)
MIWNYLLFILCGLLVGYLGHYFDINKTKGLEIYLIVGVLVSYAACFIIHFLIWPVAVGEVNYVAVVLGSLVTYFSLRLIDYYFHL